jgi:hypothetical protein
MREGEQRQARDDVSPAPRGAEHQPRHEQHVIEPLWDDVLEAEQDESPREA